VKTSDIFVPCRNKCVAATQGRNASKAARDRKGHLLGVRIRVQQDSIICHSELMWSLEFRGFEEKEPLFGGI